MNKTKLPVTNIDRSETTYIYSSDGGKRQKAIPIVLKSLAQGLDVEPNSSLTIGYMNQKIGVNDIRNQINIEFDRLDKEELAEIDEIRIKIDEDDISGMSAEAEDITVSRLKITLPRGRMQDNLPLLLRQAAQIIENLDADDITDLVIHNYMDHENFIDRPYIHVYYLSKQR